jgi:hypothetical protein
LLENATNLLLLERLAQVTLESDHGRTKGTGRDDLRARLLRRVSQNTLGYNLAALKYLQRQHEANKVAEF